MSSLHIKTIYYEEGPYGSIQPKKLFARHNSSCDTVSFYDDNGSLLLTMNTTISNNLLDAINRLNSCQQSGSTNKSINTDDTLLMTDEEIKLCQ